MKLRCYEKPQQNRKLITKRVWFVSKCFSDWAFFLERNGDFGGVSPSEFRAIPQRSRRAAVDPSRRNRSVASCVSRFRTSHIGSADASCQIFLPFFFSASVRAQTREGINFCSFTWRRVRLRRSCRSNRRRRLHSHPRQRGIRCVVLLTAHSSTSGLPSSLLWTKRTKPAGSNRRAYNGLRKIISKVEERKENEGRAKGGRVAKKKNNIRI